MAKGSSKPKSSTTLKGGLTNRSPDAPSKKVSGPNVDKTGRSGVAPTPKTLGPRYA